MKIYNLENSFISAEFLSLGATVLRLTIKPLERNVILTNRNLADYKKADAGYYGATVGPVAGRIKNARYKIGEKVVELDKNEHNKNTLHGGPNGFSFQEFTVKEQTKERIVFMYEHFENVDKFNGDYIVYVVYTLLSDGISAEYAVKTKERTLLNITNHAYFNLDSSGDILKHELKANTIGYYDFDDEQINTNFIKLSPGDALDLSKKKELKELVFNPALYKRPSCGLDHLYVLHDGKIVFKGQNLSLEVTSNYAAVQLYATNFPAPYLVENFGKLQKHAALAIEPVDVVREKDGKYEEIEIGADETYYRKITYKFTLF